MNPLKTILVVQLTLILLVLSVFTIGLKEISYSVQLSSQVPVQGSPGNIGPIGPTGLTGLQGLQGIPGESGPIGSQGLPGANGITGATGTTGPQGDRGPKGDTGPQGPQGDIGPPAQTTQLRLNPTTGKLECKLSGDILWTVLTNPGDACP